MHMPTKLERGIEAAKAGEVETARRLLAASLERDPNSEKAWLWMTAVTDDEAERRVFLKQVLRINPNSEPARLGLALLDAQRAPAVEPPGEPEQQPLSHEDRPLPSALEATAPVEAAVPGEEEETGPVSASAAAPGQTPEPALLATADHQTEVAAASARQEGAPQDHMPTESLSPSDPQTPPTDAFAPTEPLFPPQADGPTADRQAPTEPVVPSVPDAPVSGPFALTEPLACVDQEPDTVKEVAASAEALPPGDEILQTGRGLPLQTTPGRVITEAGAPETRHRIREASPEDEEADSRLEKPGALAPADADYSHSDWPPVDDVARPEPGLWHKLTPPGIPLEAESSSDVPADVWQHETVADDQVDGTVEAPAGGIAAFLGGISPLLLLAAAILTVTIAIVVLWVASPGLREALSYRSSRTPEETAVSVSEPTKQPQLRPVLESNVTVVSAWTATTCDPCSGGTSVAAGATATAGLPTAGPAPSTTRSPSEALPPVEASPPALPVPSVPDPLAWIVAYVTQSPASGTVHSLTHLQEEAVARGIEFQVLAHEAAFLQALQQPGVTAALYGGMGSTEALWSLDDLLNRGGRVVLLYNDAWQAQNELLDILFGVTIEPEQVVAARDTFVYPPPLLLPDWLSGLNLALRQEGSNLGITAYLHTTHPEGEKGQMTSQASGENRLLVYATPDRAVTFWPAVTLSPGPGAVAILDHYFSDRSIGRFANLGGARRLLDRLAGQ